MAMDYNNMIGAARGMAKVPTAGRNFRNLPYIGAAGARRLPLPGAVARPAMVPQFSERLASSPLARIARAAAQVTPMAEGTMAQAGSRVPVTPSMMARRAPDIETARRALRAMSQSSMKLPRTM